MKFTVAAAIMLLNVSGSGAIASPGSDGRDLQSILYCLKQGSNPMLSGGRLGRTAKVRVNYARDDAAFPGKRHLLVFIETRHGSYEAFDVEVAGRKYDIRNNATIKMAGNEIVYINELLGGVRTHDFVSQNFRKALRHRPVIVADDRRSLPIPICRQIGTPADAN